MSAAVIHVIMILRYLDGIFINTSDRFREICFAFLSKPLLIEN